MKIGDMVISDKFGLFGEVLDVLPCWEENCDKDTIRITPMFSIGRDVNSYYHVEDFIVIPVEDGA